MNEKERKDGEPASLRHEIRGFAGRILDEVKDGKIEKIDQVVESCSNLLDHETTPERTEHLLNLICLRFADMGPKCPKACLYAASKLIERIKTEPLDGEPVQTEQLNTNDTTPAAPISEVPTQAAAPVGALAQNSNTATTLMKVADIRVADPFKGLLPIKPQTLGAVTASIKAHGYDVAQPVVLWGTILVDGHTRLEGAKAAELDEIPVVVRSFASEDDAVEYSIRCQRDRRNLTDAELRHLVEVIDKRRKRGGDQRKSEASSEASGKSAAKTAELIGTSTSKIEKARVINDSGDEKLKAEVDAGEKSLNQASTEIRNKKRSSDAKLQTACRKAVTSLNAAEKSIRPYDTDLADKIGTLQTAVQDLIKRNKAEADAAAKSENTSKGSANAGKKGRRKAGELTTQE